MDYKGYIEVQFDDDRLAHFYNNKEVYAELFNLKENQFFLVCDKTGEVVDRYCFQNGELRQVMFHKLGGTYTGAVLRSRNNIYPQPHQFCRIQEKTNFPSS